MSMVGGLSIFLTGLMATWIGYGAVFESGIESPRYETIEKSGPYSVRDYERFIVASTQVPDSDEGNSSGFRTLAGYIFGQNNRAEKMSMTAPVMYTNRQSKRHFSFVMPAHFSIENLPEPNRSSITIEHFESGKYAVHSFRGGVNPKKVDKKVSNLVQYIESKNLSPIGEPIIAQYNSPWVFPLQRKNEIWLRVTDDNQND